jgi:hypothetical protein
MPDRAPRSLFMRWFHLLALLGLAPACWACSLTSDPFEPRKLVVSSEGGDASETPASPASPAPEVDETPGVECVGSSRLPGCVTELMPPPMEVAQEIDAGAGSGLQSAGCDDDRDCASGTCVRGRCAPRPSDAGTTSPPVVTPASCAAAPECRTGDACLDDTDCTSQVCGEAGCTAGTELCCQAPACDDGKRNGAETAIDCGGSCTGCAPGVLCKVDADCQSGACEEGRCCGGSTVDCTRCARRLVIDLSCATTSDPVATEDCDRFLDCLADNPELCPVRHAEGCSSDPDGVCNHVLFGGNAGPGVVLADRILGTAVCFF